MTVTIELEQSAEEELLRKAERAGNDPGTFAAEVLQTFLRYSSSDASESATHTDDRGWLRSAAGDALGYDGMTWREIAHADHKY